MCYAYMEGVKGGYGMQVMHSFVDGRHASDDEEGGLEI
jgi:hypothetical protein